MTYLCRAGGRRGGCDGMGVRRGLWQLNSVLSIHACLWRCTVQHSKSATGIAKDIACLTIYTQNADYTQDTLAPYKKSCRVCAAVKLLPVSQLLLKQAAFCNVCMRQCAIICHIWLLAARMAFVHSKQSVMITKQAAPLLACACFKPASSTQQRICCRQDAVWICCAMQEEAEEWCTGLPTL